jgi:hypothetical protein
MAGPKRSEMLQEYGHAGGHLREALENAREFGDEWWHQVEIDFFRERHNRWWSRLSHAKRAHWLPGQPWNCTDVSADLKGSQSRRFGWEPESWPMVAGHTNAPAAVGNRQSRFRVCCPPTMVSSWALLPRRPLKA